MKELKKNIVKEDWVWCWYIDNFLLFKDSSRANVEFALWEFMKSINVSLYLEKNTKTFLNYDYIKNEDRD